MAESPAPFSCGSCETDTSHARNGALVLSFGQPPPPGTDHVWRPKVAGGSVPLALTTGLAIQFTAKSCTFVAWTSVQRSEKTGASCIHWGMSLSGCDYTLKENCLVLPTPGPGPWPALALALPLTGMKTVKDFKVRQRLGFTNVLMLAQLHQALNFGTLPDRWQPPDKSMLVDGKFLSYEDATRLHKHLPADLCRQLDHLVLPSILASRQKTFSLEEAPASVSSATPSLSSSTVAPVLAMPSTGSCTPGHVLLQSARVPLMEGSVSLSSTAPGLAFTPAGYGSTPVLAAGTFSAMWNTPAGRPDEALRQILAQTSSHAELQGFQASLQARLDERMTPSLTQKPSMQGATEAAPGTHSTEARSGGAMVASIEHDGGLDDDGEMQDASPGNTSKMSLSVTEELMSSMSLDTSGDMSGSDANTPRRQQQAGFDSISPVRSQNLQPAAPGADAEMMQLRQNLEDALQKLSQCEKDLTASR